MSFSKQWLPWVVKLIIKQLNLSSLSAERTMTTCGQRPWNCDTSHLFSTLPLYSEITWCCLSFNRQWVLRSPLLLFSYWCLTFLHSWYNWCGQGSSNVLGSGGSGGAPVFVGQSELKMIQQYPEGDSSPNAYWHTLIHTLNVWAEGALCVQQSERISHFLDRLLLYILCSTFLLFTFLCMKKCIIEK